MGILYKSMEVQNKLGSNQIGLGVEQWEYHVNHRWYGDMQTRSKKNTDCLVKEQEKEYQTGWKIKTGNVLDSCNQSMRRSRFFGQMDLKHNVYITLVNQGIWVSMKVGNTRKLSLVLVVGRVHAGCCKEYEFEGGNHRTVIHLRVVTSGKCDHVDGSQEMIWISDNDVYVFQKMVERNAMDDSVWILLGSSPGFAGLKCKGKYIGLEIIKDRSGNTLRKLEAQGICMVARRLDIVSEDVGMLDKYDRGLQKDVQAYMIGKPSSQAVDSQVIRSIGEDVGGLMNSNLQGDKAGDGTTSMVVWPGNF
ncbi:hypothetical protein Tco_0086752 [Tanacetum coccineum]